MRRWRTFGQRGLSSLLALILCVGLLPAPASARGDCPCGRETCVCEEADCGCEASCDCDLCLPAEDSPLETADGEEAEDEDPWDLSGEAELPEDQDAPETPEDGETPEDSEAPEDGETPENREAPEAAETPEDPETPEDGETPEDSEPADEIREDAPEEGVIFKEEGTAWGTLRLLDPDGDEDQESGTRALYLDGKLLQADADDFCTAGETVFFSGARGICRYDLSSGDTKVLRSGLRLSRLTVFRGILFGLEDPLVRLCAVEPDSGRVTVTNYTNVSSFQFENGRLHVTLLADPDLLEGAEAADFAVTAAQAVAGAASVTDLNGGLRNLLKLTAGGQSDGESVFLASVGDDEDALPLDALVSVSLLASTTQSAVLSTYRIYCAQLDGNTLEKLGEFGNSSFSHANEKHRYSYDLNIGKHKSQTGGKRVPGDLTAPFDGRITYLEKGGNHMVCFTSLNPVLLANGKQTYLTVTTLHDDNIEDLYVGKVFKQGEVYAQEGNYGKSDGIHTHMECATISDPNAKVGKEVRGNILPNDALFRYTKTTLERRTEESKKKKGTWQDKDHNPVWKVYSGSLASIPTDGVTISPVSYPTGTLKRGSTFALTGTVKSNDPIKQITAAVCRVGTNAVAYSGYVCPSTTVRSYTLAGSALAKKIQFEKLSEGQYYLEYTVIAQNGKWGTWKSPAFAVKDELKMPTIGEQLIDGGRKITIKASEGNVHWQLNGGGEMTGGETVTRNFTGTGTYSIVAWAVKGSMSSKKTSKTVTVQQAAAPQISNLIIQGARAYVTISGTGTGTIYYTTDGSAPTTSSAKYSGPIEIKGDCTVKAMAAVSGKANSGIAQRTITRTAPGQVTSITVLNGGGRIAAGKAVTVRWNAVEGAASYTARLYYEDVCKEEKLVSGTTAAFTLKEAGKYTVRVVAANQFGSSAESTTYAAVEAMAPVTVTVVDQIYRSGTMNDAAVAALEQRIRDHKNDQAFKLEGNVLYTQTVPYGTAVLQPSPLTKEGFGFGSFTWLWNTPVTEDTTVYALFSPQKYTVSFYDYRLTASGAQTELLASQRVEYAGSATPPAVTPPAGYILAGWSVDPGTSGSADLSFISGDMKLYTSYTWATQDLPAKVTINSVVRNERLTSYTVNLTYANTNLKDTQARLIVSAYASDEHMVYTQTKDLDLNALPMETTNTDSITLNYAKKIAKVTAVLVYVKNGLTGGAASEMASFENITFPASGGWSDWSEWDTTKYTSSLDKEVEEKKQYRYSYATSYCVSSEAEYHDYKNSSEWQQTTVNTTTGNWSAWSQTRYSTINSYTKKREVETRSVAATYKTQYHYYRFYKGSSAPWTSYDATSHPYFEEYWSDTELPYQRTSGGVKQYGDSYTGKAGSKYWLKFDGVTAVGGKDAVTRGLVTGSNIAWTRKVQTGGGYTEYRYRDTIYRYLFIKWEVRTGWIDTESIEIDGYRKREEQTVYRYRTFTSSASSQDEEERSDAAYIVPYELTDLPESSENRAATLLVYKKTNTDPTEAQLEYVYQIQIPPGGGKSCTGTITIRPREALSAETGDFVVTLSVQGCDRLVNVGVIQAPRAAYTVDFYAGNEWLGQQKVPAGGTADLSKISVSNKQGLRFVGWDPSPTNISYDQQISAVYEPETVTVLFVDHANGTVESMEFTYGTPITAPTPEAEGRTFQGWEGFTEGVTATESAVYVAKWDPITYKVSFRAPDGTEVKEQDVAYGEAATPPSGSDYVWDTEGDTWWNVTGNMVIYPYVLTKYPLAMPDVSIPAGSVPGDFDVELIRTAEDTEIYYTVDEPLDEAGALAFLAGRMSAVPETEETVFLESVEEGEADSDEEEGEVNPDEAEEVADYTVWEPIHHYDGTPVSLTAGSTLYAFSANSAGEISAVSVFAYTAEEDSGDDPGTEEITPIGSVSYQSGSGTVEAVIGYPDPALVIAAAYDGYGRMLAVRLAETGGAQTVSISLAANAAEVKVFLVEKGTYLPLYEAKAAKIQ